LRRGHPALGSHKLLEGRVRGKDRPVTEVNEKMIKGPLLNKNTLSQVFGKNQQRDG